MVTTILGNGRALSGAGRDVGYTNFRDASTKCTHARVRRAGCEDVQSLSGRRLRLRWRKSQNMYDWGFVFDMYKGMDVKIGNGRKCEQRSRFLQGRFGPL